MLADDLLALMDGLGLAHSAVGGASMGCATALYATVAAPDRIDRLVLVIPPTAWETRAAQREVYLAAAQLVEDRGPAAMAEQLRRQPPGRRVRRRRRTPARRGPGAATPSSTGRSWRRSCAGRRRRTCRRSTCCARIRQPALVLAWSGDGGHPTSTAERLAEVLPAAELHVADDLATIARWPDLVRDFVTA